MKTPRIYWHGAGCYCDAVRLPEDAPCPVCDSWPRPEVRTMPNGCRYIASESEPLQNTQAVALPNTMMSHGADCSRPKL